LQQPAPLQQLLSQLSLQQPVQPLPQEQPHTTPSLPGVLGKPPVCWRLSNKFRPCIDRLILQVLEPLQHAPPKALSQPPSNESLSS
jgi:hypothetical protein